MFFLHPGSIVHLMVNRKLRSACEQFLYRDIHVIDRANRSLCLLTTFVIRPDLALLVRTLRINLDWCIPNGPSKYAIPRLLQPDGIVALSLAKNIRSLSLPDLGWLSDPSLAHICEVVSQMELTSLAIAERYSPDPNIELTMSNLRSTLLSQPKLEDLFLKFHTHKSALLNEIKVQVPDVPSLNRYRGDVRFAKAFLNAATQLSTLEISFEYNDPLDNLLRESWNGNSIIDLRINVNFLDVRDWTLFGPFLACFPDIESLTLLSRNVWYDDPIPLYSKDIAPLLHVLPRLRTLEIGNMFNNIYNSGYPDPTPECILLFKKHSPTLERFVDTNERQWVYVPSDGDAGSFLPRVECQLFKRQHFWEKDLPPKWDE
ncbi:hypothetical protein FRC00_006804 [Tulasnella sp. 408]|nr:hypothetical protein FRC00_006804 [Tulasnella sp. 408]